MASRLKDINQTLPKRGQIKIKIYKMIANSLTNLSKKNTATMISLETGGGIKSRAKHVIKRHRPKRGQIKSIMIKKIAKWVTDLVIGVAGEKKKAAGNGCFTSPATVVPVDVVGEMEKGFKGEIKKKKVWVY